MAVKKLIEVAMPLDAINAAAVREKSIRHGHPSGFHIWWARRPMVTARAVIWASLVDDPSSHPEQFPTEKEQETERERLFDILRQLVIWENTNNEDLLKQAKDEIAKSMGGDIPAFLDPFAGGGALPLEAQRLGLKSYGADLNPVPVVINKSMIDVPQRFAGLPPINNASRHSKISQDWNGSEGLAADVKHYGELVKQSAWQRVGRYYPKVKVPASQGGGEATVIAWIWATTVDCPNPVCGSTSILCKTYDISKKRGKLWHVVPTAKDGTITFETKEGRSPIAGTVARTGAKCIHCGSTISLDYIREAGRNHKLNHQLMAVVAEGNRGRLFISPDDEQITAANAVKRPDEAPSCELAGKAKVNVGLYGRLETSDLFSDRQLAALLAFSDATEEIQHKVLEDALSCGMEDDSIPLNEGGTGALAYSQAVQMYLAFLVDQLTNQCGLACSWHPNNVQMKNVFSRQAIPMVWDYAESNPFSNSSGCYGNLLDRAVEAFSGLPKHEIVGTAFQNDAQQDNGLRGLIISTDPPYYDNIDYADLSDYFYVWLRRNLRNVYPDLFSTMVTPKLEELVATPYLRGKEAARDFFEQGMFNAFRQFYEYACDDVPVTIYYAYKQSETTTTNLVEKTASTGWETMLSAIIRAGFTIVGTWPMQTEMTTALKDKQNVLASSIVLVCRKRDIGSPACTRRDFISVLRKELRSSLDKLQTSNIAPVDLAQSAIGPGIGAYSRFSVVYEADGTEMTVRSALHIINQELDLYFSDQDSDLDRESRFCLDLYTQSALDEIRFGEADVLARAKNTSIEGVVLKGALSSSKGVVRLLGRDEVRDTPSPDFCWLFTQQLAYAIETGGVEACAKILRDVYDSRAENAKALAYRLFTIADKKGWAQEAFAYNSLVVAWPDIQARAAQLQQETPVQTALDI